MDAKGAPAAAYRFDRFILDLARGALLGPDGAEIQLRPKSFALLRLLVEHAGRLLDRDIILATIWPDVVVGEEAITQCVHAVRKALGDEAQQLLKTVPKRGYLLAAEVVPTETTAPVPRVERRLAAILAADIVGYSRLIEADEAGTLAAIKGLREQAIDPLLAEHKGRIVKLMGDGAIVEFASVVDAVACAVAVQKAVADRQAKSPPERRIVFRIGVNLGDVVVDGDDLLGDGVNVAARLEQLCEPGGVLVSGTAFDHLQGRLGLPLEFTGEQQVKNIARPVRAYRVRLDGTEARLETHRSAWVSRRAIAAAAALLLVALLAGGIWGFWQAAAPAAVPSIAVLPLDNRSGDERIGRLADGMINNVIADLSGLGWNVMARGTTYAYRDSPQDPRRIGTELGVTYIVEGSLDGDGTRLLATISLVDATTGRQVWSERYDRRLDDLFAVQDELATQITTSLGGYQGTVLRARLDAARRKHPGNLDAFDLTLLGNAELENGTEEANAKAVDLLQRAGELDPTNSAPPTALADAYRQQIDNDWSAYDDAMARWLDAANRAVQLDHRNGYARYMLAQRYLYANEQDRWWSELQQAADLAKPDVNLMAQMGGIDLPQAGQTARGVELVERAVRLDPANVDTYRWAQRNVYFFARRFEEAAIAADAVDNPSSWGKLFNTLINAQLGRATEMETWRAKLLDGDPDVSAERVFARTGDFLLPQAAAERALFLDSMTKAGLPICATPEQLAKEPELRHLAQCDAERAKTAAKS